MNKNNKKSESIKELYDKVLLRTKGHTSIVNDYLAPMDHVLDINKLTNIGSYDLSTNGNNNNMPSLLSIAGKDIKNNKNLDDEIGDILNKESEELLHTVYNNGDYNKVKGNILEINYIVNQMPSLYNAIETLVDKIMSPNNSTKTTYGVTDNFADLKETFGEIDRDNMNKMIGLDNDSNTVFDINDNLMSNIRNILIKTLLFGFTITYTTPFKELAKRLYVDSVRRNADGFLTESFEDISNTVKTDIKDNIAEAIYNDNKPLLYKYMSGDTLQEDFSIAGDMENTVFDGTSIFAETFGVTSNEYDNIIRNIIVDNPIPDDMKDGIYRELMETINDDSMTETFENIVKDFNQQNKTQTSKKNIDNKLKKSALNTFNTIRGGNAKILEHTNVIPIELNNKLIGVYYIEEDKTRNDNNMKSSKVHNMANAVGSNAIDANQNINMTPDTIFYKKIMTDIRSVLARNLDNKKFIKRNAGILDDIEMAVNNINTDIRSIKIRFIPAKFLTMFKNGEGVYGRSALALARVIAHMWILLSKGKVIDKLFYERDKFFVKYKLNKNASTSSERVVNNVMKNLVNLVPTPTDITNISRMNKIGNKSIILMPEVDGEAIIDVDRVAGQKTDNNIDYIDKLERIASSLVGIDGGTLNDMSDREYKTATEIMQESERDVSKVIRYQTMFNYSVSRYSTLLARVRSGIDELIYGVYFLPPLGLDRNNQSDILNNITTRVDFIITALGDNYTDDKYGDLMEKIKYEIYKKESKGVIDDWDNIEKMIGDRINNVNDTEESED